DQRHHRCCPHCPLGPAGPSARSTWMRWASTVSAPSRSTSSAPSSCSSWEVIRRVCTHIREASEETANTPSAEAPAPTSREWVTSPVVEVAIVSRTTASAMNSPISAIRAQRLRDRKSTRLNSSHVSISYAVFCLKKKKQKYIKR